jgi:hypothetical protein
MRECEKRIQRKYSELTGKDWRMGKVHNEGSVI